MDIRYFLVRKLLQICLNSMTTKIMPRKYKFSNIIILVYDLYDMMMLQWYLVVWKVACSKLLSVSTLFTYLTIVHV